MRWIVSVSWASVATVVLLECWMTLTVTFHYTIADICYG